MAKYQITLKSQDVIALTGVSEDKNPIGLFIWAGRQSADKILTFFDEGTGIEYAIKASEIVVISKLEGEHELPHNPNEFYKGFEENRGSRFDERR